MLLSWLRGSQVAKQQKALALLTISNLKRCIQVAFWKTQFLSICSCYFKSSLIAAVACQQLVSWKTLSLACLQGGIVPVISQKEANACRPLKVLA